MYILQVLAGKDIQRSFERESTRVKGRPSHRKSESSCGGVSGRRSFGGSGRRSFAEPARNTSAWAAESRALMSPPTRKRRGGEQEGQEGQAAPQVDEELDSEEGLVCRRRDGALLEQGAGEGVLRGTAVRPTAHAGDAAGRLYRSGYEPGQWLLLARRPQVELVVLEAHTQEHAARARCARES